METTIALQVQESIKFGTTFPTVKLGPHKLLRTQIPASCRLDRNFHIDDEADKKMCIKATELGVTVDELYRHLTWVYINSLD